VELLERELVRFQALSEALLVVPLWVLP